MAKDNVNIEQMIYDETEKRLAIMESPDYEFPAKSGKADYIAVGICVVCSIVLIVLCITGVIV